MKYKTDFDCKIPYSDKHFQKIIQYFLFECPVKGKSNRGRTFDEIGWIGRRGFGELKRKMLTINDSEINEHYYPCTKNELDAAYSKCGALEPPIEFCVFLKYDEKLVMQSLFGAIRNAFAHGSFNVYTYKKIKIYYFENFEGYLKAKMAIKESTLLEWIKFVKKEK